MNRGIGICHYNRQNNLNELLDAVKKTAPNETKIVLCDDGSEANIEKYAKKHGVLYIKGTNKGIGFNKNRALWALQDCHFLTIIEDDLVPQEKGWFEIYEQVAMLTGNHHFCRVQDKEIPDSHHSFSSWLGQQGYTPMFASSPRGDLTFLTKKVITTVGGFHPNFKGIGYAHGEWSNRVAKAGLINHPLKWWDVKEANLKFKQLGDTSGGRFKFNEDQTATQLRTNRNVFKQLDKQNYIYHPLVLG